VAKLSVGRGRAPALPWLATKMFLYVCCIHMDEMYRFDWEDFFREKKYTWPLPCWAVCFGLLASCPRLFPSPSSRQNLIDAHCVGFSVFVYPPPSLISPDRFSWAEPIKRHRSLFYRFCDTRFSDFLILFLLVFLYDFFNTVFRFFLFVFYFSVLWFIFSNLFSFLFYFKNFNFLSVSDLNKFEFEQIQIWTKSSLNKFEFEFAQIRVWTNLSLNKFEFKQIWVWTYFLDLTWHSNLNKIKFEQIFGLQETEEKWKQNSAELGRPTR
jgi:hypothetical protein